MQINESKISVMPHDNINWSFPDKILTDDKKNTNIVYSLYPTCNDGYMPHYVIEDVEEAVQNAKYDVLKMPGNLLDTKFFRSYFSILSDAQHNDNLVESNSNALVGVLMYLEKSILKNKSIPVVFADIFLFPVHLFRLLDEIHDVKLFEASFRNIQNIINIIVQVNNHYVHNFPYDCISIDEKHAFMIELHDFFVKARLSLTVSDIKFIKSMYNYNDYVAYYNSRCNDAKIKSVEPGFASSRPDGLNLQCPFLFMMNFLMFLKTFDQKMLIVNIPYIEAENVKRLIEYAQVNKN